MNRRMRKIMTRLVLAFLLSLNLSCSGVRSSPSLDQGQSPGATGLHIVYNATGSIRKGIAQILTLTPSKIEYYVDGKLVAETLEVHDMHTFVRVAPGEHAFMFQFTARGVMSLGTKIRGTEHKYRFLLTDGQTGTFNHVLESSSGFSGVEFWETAD